MHENLSPDFEFRRVAFPFKPVRNRIDSFYISSHVITLRSVTAGNPPYQFPILVSLANRKAFKLKLSYIFKIISDGLANTVIKFFQILLIIGIAQ